MGESMKVWEIETSSTENPSAFTLLMFVSSTAVAERVLIVPGHLQHLHGPA